MTNLPEFLQKQLTTPNSRPKFFPEEIKDHILQYGVELNYPNTKELEGDKLIALWFRFMKSNITEVGKCGFNGCENNNRIVNDSKSNGFKISVGCCVKHSVKISMMEKYGVENAMDLQSTKTKIKKTNLKKYGCENAAQSKMVKDKMKKTNIERYGVENVFQSEEKKAIIKKSNIEKYGCENPSQSDEIKAKKIKTSLKNYGVKNPMQSKIITDRIKVTNLERYGETSVMHIAEIVDRAQKNAFKQKEYIWKTGEISLLQGYEPIVLKELEENGYTYKDVLTELTDMPYIEYFFENKKHVYFPDFYIPTENTIIEVKSTYTLEKDWIQNQAKFKATTDLGFNFQLEVR